MFYIVNGPDNYQHENLIEFILACRDSYRDNLYHNWEHAFNVTHCMFNILTRNEQHFNELEVLKAAVAFKYFYYLIFFNQKDALLIACLCHDMDHRGVTSNFLGLTNDILVELYETSPMERHHYKMTTVLLDVTTIPISKTATKRIHVILPFRCIPF